MLDHFLDRAFGDLALLGRQPDAPLEKSAGKTPKSTNKSVSPKKDKKRRAEFSTLVETKLYYRVAISSCDQGASSASAPLPGPEVKAAEDVFVHAFNEVWNHLPEVDQDRLLAYWASPPRAMELAATPRPRPLIQIVNTGPWNPSCLTYPKLDGELNFPIALIICHPDRLRYEIARTLAIVYRVATRAHWHLVMEMLEKPLVQWEKSKTRITEAALDKKQEALEKEYLVVYEQQVAQLLKGWRIAEPSGVG